MSLLAQIEATNASSVKFDLTDKRVFVAGHTGMAGSAILRRLRREACNVLVAERSELDLTRQDQTERYLSAIRPDVVIMAAGRVGGIFANSEYPVNFLDENLAMALNCIHDKPRPWFSLPVPVPNVEQCSAHRAFRDLKALGVFRHAQPLLFCKYRMPECEAW